MKKLLVLSTFIAVIMQGANAQELGVRSGYFANNFVAMDAVFSLGPFSRLHGDVSVGGGIGANLFWDFVYQPLTIGGERGFNWYIGAGPSVYAGYDYVDRADRNIFIVGPSAEFGLEYHFNFPLAVGVDIRPTIWLGDRNTFGGGGGAMARYVFGR